MKRMGRRPGKPSHGAERGKGQALVEFALVLPIALFLLLIMLEVGLAFSHKLTVGYASREGARTGAALGNGGAASCSGSDPNAALAAAVDKQIIAATQRILKSPGSDIILSNVSEDQDLQVVGHRRPGRGFRQRLDVHARRRTRHRRWRQRRPPRLLPVERRLGGLQPGQCDQPRFDRRESGLHLPPLHTDGGHRPAHRRIPGHHLCPE